MEVFLAAAVIFAIAFLGMTISVMRGKHCPGCSCKAARRIMKRAEPADCVGRLHQLSNGGDPP